ncbi:MAG: 3-phosphoshikimate 1-carboxyvinyltransferase [Candidatus Omnitrophota bacterium]
MKLQNLNNLRGNVSLPGDKSVSHRALMISSIAKGVSYVSNLLDGLDCDATADAFRQLGISIEAKGDRVTAIHGKGLRGLKVPDSDLYLGNSGTTMRLILGILAGQDFKATLTGDESLSKRPMKRVTQPLRRMGADIVGVDDANLAPITIKGGRLRGINHNSNVASAQVKSSVILAGLYADGITRVAEPHKSRDHTERMLKLFGAELEEEDLFVSVKGIAQGAELAPQSIKIPGDISSAAFFIALGVLTKGSELTLLSCGINPTRDGILKVLDKMGADIELTNPGRDYEPTADIVVRSSKLRAADIFNQEIPLLIDEIPIIALCATQAEGTTTIEGVSELRVKETDRVNSIVSNLHKMGADIRAENDNIVIKGPSKLKAAEVESFHDHRTAMMLAIAGCIADGTTIVNNTDCIATSFPAFMDTLKGLAV